MRDRAGVHLETDSNPQLQNIAPPRLDYAKRPALRWVSRHRRLLISLALLLAIAGPVWWYWQPLKLRAQWLYWSRQAAAHVMPRVAPIQVTDNVEKQKLASNPDYVTMKSAGQAPSVAIYSPRVLRELVEMDARLAEFKDEPIVFVGTLQRPDGTPRLVVIARHSSRGGFSSIVSYRAVVLPKPGLFDPLPQNSQPTQMVGGGYPAQNGFRDPNDPTHVIFEPAAPGGTRSDSYLQDDDSIRTVYEPTDPLQRLMNEKVERRVY